MVSIPKHVQKFFSGKMAWVASARSAIMAASSTLQAASPQRSASTRGGGNERGHWGAAGAAPGSCSTWQDDDKRNWPGRGGVRRGAE
jgi:hypothetical protein